MAAESRESHDDGHHWKGGPKVFRIDGGLLGCAGDSDMIAQFMAWYADKASERPDLTDFEALLINEEGIFYFADSTYPAIVDEPYFAIGTGAPYAIGAMAVGASPTMAVGIACQFDSNSGPPIVTQSLEV